MYYSHTTILAFCFVPRVYREQRRYYVARSVTGTYAVPAWRFHLMYDCIMRVTYMVCSTLKAGRVS